MSFLASLLAWANMPFTIALTITVLFAALQMTGALGLLAGGGDADGDGDGDGDADGHDADVDADGHDGDDGDDSDHDGDEGARFGFWEGLGVGRVPMTIIWQTFAATFAFAGLAMNTMYLARHDSLPLISLAWTMPSALVFAYASTRTISGMLGRVLVDAGQQATSRKELVGRAGVVISSRVNHEFGEVRIADKTGHVVRVICHTRAGDAPIAEGADVVVVEVDEHHGRIVVAPM